MMVFCISRKYPTRMARYASDMLEFYLRTVFDGLNMGCLLPTIPTGRPRPKGCMLMVKSTDFGQSIIQMGKWLREGTTRMAKRWAIGSFGAAMARLKKARTTPFQTDGLSHAGRLVRFDHRRAYDSILPPAAKDMRYVNQPSSSETIHSVPGDPVV
jgi:hypothetical protein